jgi:hypothetical protein
MNETARVSTPEADVPVPPPPAQDEVAAAARIPQDQDLEPTEWWQTPTGKVLGVVVAVTVLAILANINGGLAIMILAIGGLAAFALYNRRGDQAQSAGERGGRRVLRPGFDEPVSEAERRRELEAEIAQYMSEGFFVRQRTATTAQLVRPKRFSFIWALLWFLVFGIGIVVYLIYYAPSRMRAATLRLTSTERSKPRGRYATFSSSSLVATDRCLREFVCAALSEVCCPQEPRMQLPISATHPHPAAQDDRSLVGETPVRRGLRPTVYSPSAYR